MTASDNLKHKETEPGKLKVANTQMAKLLDTYRMNRREHGVCEADREWMREPIKLWCHEITGGQESIAADSSPLMAIAVGMSETLPIRDAIIISMLCPRSMLSYKDLLRLCAEPYAQGNVQILCQSIDCAFTDPSMHPDVERCRNGLDLLDVMVTAMPDAYHEQPLAIMGYISWWLNREEGLDYAYQALQLNPQCTLASIITTAYQHGVKPAWVKRSRQNQ
ncbi:hypothetical protein KIMH_09020 [Bombiscardovia apis]|uniref:DUF4192 family protein n=1 Tax=Bombiscardovia apis TaxID=2932182 RepID=A0ABM8BD00_9BIFI|nr:hypothetical protein [Bombiscardovia apis]BDR54791.1 hypothetical protein KIMH_09020 [Bombiscardovia apis]